MNTEKALSRITKLVEDAIQVIDEGTPEFLPSLLNDISTSISQLRDYHLEP